VGHIFSPRRINQFQPLCGSRQEQAEWPDGPLERYG
jgi:hypothetical protein